MKKSFKKAGAAVLSMAMLLSMGAISLPVYAAESITPATVTFKITGLSNNVTYQGEGARDNVNGDGSDSAAITKKGSGNYAPKYDYWTLGSNDGLESATVSMYRIAQLTNDKGWQWEDYITNYRTNKEDLPSFVEFAELMKNKDGSGEVGLTEEKEFKTPSTVLQEMASYFERIVESLENDAVDDEAANHETAVTTLGKVKVSERTFGNSEITGNGVNLIVTDVNALNTNGDGVLNETTEAALTQNVIGYYLIVTKTEQSGAIVQPILVCLKNGEHKSVAAKGTSITFEKTMTEIVSNDENANKSEDTTDPKRFLATQKSGLVEQDDIVKFKIVTKIPKYDPNVASKDIVPFTVTDTASEGLYLDIFKEDGTTIDETKFNVYLLNKDDEAQSKGWTLQGNKDVENVGDYTLTVDNSNTTNHTFKLQLSGYQLREADNLRNEDVSGAIAGSGQLRGEPTSHTETVDEETVTVSGDGVIDDVPMILSQGATAPGAAEAGSMKKATRLDSNYNKGGLENMQGKYLVIEYQALVNRANNGAKVTDETLADGSGGFAFDRAFNDYKTLADLTSTNVAAVGEVPAERVGKYTQLGDINKQVARVQLANGETRYNKQYTAADDYGAKKGLFADMDEDAAKALATVLKAGLVTAGANADDLDADGIAGYLTENTDSAEGKYYRILALLALDKLNIKLNGEYNTAHMTYGSRYATGTDVNQLNTDYSKVYSVDLELSKWIEVANIEGRPAMDYNKTSVGQYAQANMDKAVVIPKQGGTENETISVKLSQIATPKDDTDMSKFVTKEEVNKTDEEIQTLLSDIIGTGKTYDNLAAFVAHYNASGSSRIGEDNFGFIGQNPSDAQKAYACYLLDTKKAAIEDSNEYKSANALNATAPTTATDKTVTGKVDRVTGEALADQTLTADTDAETFYDSGLNSAQQKLANYMAGAYITAQSADGAEQYAERYDEKPVVGAIFHLVRKVDNSTNIDMGYAVSGPDGKLHKLTIPTITTTNGGVSTTTEYTSNNEFSTWPAGLDQGTTLPSGNKAFYFKGDDGKWRVGYTKYSVGTNGTENFTGDTTWRMLDVGEYTVSELSVPTGYKKWAAPISFKIKAKQDEGGIYLAEDAYTGEFKAISTYTPEEEAVASHGFTSIEELRSNVGTVTFDYDKTTGTLSHKMYNEYLDQLPATGGMGTVLFTAGGIAVILMAGALFVVYMKKRNAEEEE